MPRRRIDPISLSFLDAMTCGFGAVILFFMIINATVGTTAERVTADLRSEVDRLEEEVLEGYQRLVQIRNALHRVEDEQVEAGGLSARLLENLKEIEQDLALLDDSTLSRREHINRLKADLRSLEEDAKRLSASVPSDEEAGHRLRSFVGDGDRQYLTGLKVGGRRIFILVDSSASMLADTIVNIIRRRNLPDDVKIRAEKWQQAVKTVDWLSTQIPQDSQFQIYTFDDTAQPAVAGSDGTWLDGGDREALDRAMEGLRAVVPGGGTSLASGIAALRSMRPPPDNLILLVDSLPTRGESAPSRLSVTAKQRLKLFQQAVGKLPSRLPVNVVLFPMEGDPMAASAYWKLAMNTGGSYLSPSADWP